MDINEIARRAGVSRTTVSRYLNDGYVSEEKRERIRRIINETGYVPSQHARQLRTGKTGLVGVIMPKINSQSIGRMIAGITSELSHAGMQALLANTSADGQWDEVNFINLFAEQNRVEGIILIATVLTPEHTRAIEAIDIPLVVLGQFAEDIPCVYHDDFNAVRDLCALVLKKSRRPTYLGVFDQDIAAGSERHHGFRQACADLGIEADERAQLVVDFDADSGYFGAERLLDTVPDLDTIVCATDDIAFGAMMCMLEYGRRVPEDVQVTGVGDSMLSRIARPSLTSIHLHYETSGIAAARLLLEYIRDPNKQVEHHRMGYAIYTRSSIR